jgi:hypothetical protein
VNLVLIAGYPVVHAARLGESHPGVSPASVLRLAPEAEEVSGPDLLRPVVREGAHRHLRDVGLEETAARVARTQAAPTPLPGWATSARLLGEQLAGQPAGPPLPAILAIAERRNMALKSDDPAQVCRRLLTIFNCGSYCRGVRSSLGLARKPSSRPGWYCIRRSLVLTSAVS